MRLLGWLRRVWRRLREPDQAIPQLERWQAEQAARLEALAVQRRLLERCRRREQPDGA